MNEAILLAAHAAATWAMVGLIWFVQLVHYPLFAATGSGQFAAYEAEHTRRTTWVVAAFMPVELGTALWIALAVPDGIDPWLTWMGAVLAVGLWLVTLAVQVPQHRRLSAGFDRTTWRRLVSRNWIRTALWSVRGIVAGAMLIVV